jgi:hypothetical protein
MKVFVRRSFKDGLAVCARDLYIPFFLHQDDAEDSPALLPLLTTRSDGMRQSQNMETVAVTMVPTSVATKL